mmetsp:Transcript_87090/g.281195  ORF Transcript_87090/g.281195 Transcript_87090/m.281195 type:complete len:373 (-) Transcript_87090:94-1212(-)
MARRRDEPQQLITLFFAEGLVVKNVVGLGAFRHGCDVTRHILDNLLFKVVRLALPAELIVAEGEATSGGVGDGLLDGLPRQRHISAAHEVENLWIFAQKVRRPAVNDVSHGLFEALQKAATERRDVNRFRAILQDQALELIDHILLGHHLRHRSLGIQRCSCRPLGLPRRAQHRGGDLRQILELRQRHVAAAHNDESVGVPLQEVQRPDRSDRCHRKAISLDELAAQGRNIANGAQVLDEPLELVDDKVFVLGRIGVRDRWPRQDALLQERHIRGRLEGEHILLALKILPRAHAGNDANLLAELLGKDRLEFRDWHGFLPLLEYPLDASRDVSICHRRRYHQSVDDVFRLRVGGNAAFAQDLRDVCGRLRCL